MTGKTVYQCNPAGLFVGESLANESLWNQVCSDSGGAVEIPPPDQWPEDQWPRWNGVQWELISKPQVQQPLSPEQKLADFLNSNPDVAALINARNTA